MKEHIGLSRRDLLELLLQDEIKAIENGDIYEHGYPEGRLIPSNHRSMCEEAVLDSANEKITCEVSDILKSYMREGA